MGFELYRDDDINKYTDITTMLIIQDYFDKAKKLHTVAVEFEALWESKAIWYLLLVCQNIKIGLHGWTHKDYSTLTYDEICVDIEKSLDYWYGYVTRGYGAGALTPNKKIETFYPPWNRTSDHLHKACEKFNLKVDDRVGGQVFNFHWWEMIFGHRQEQLAGALGLLDHPSGLILPKGVK